MAELGAVVRVLGSKLVADHALERPSDTVRMRQTLEQLSEWLARAIQEGRAALNSLRTSDENSVSHEGPRVQPGLIQKLRLLACNSLGGFVVLRHRLDRRRRAAPGCRRAPLVGMEPR